MIVLRTRFGLVRVCTVAEHAALSRRKQAQRPLVLVGDKVDQRRLTPEQVEKLLAASGNPE